MLEHALIRPIDQESWNDLLLSTSGYSFFHTSNWADVLGNAYNYKPFYLYEKEGNTFIHLLPLMEVESPLTGNKGVSLPFTDICEPIARNAHEFRILFDQAVILGKKRQWKYLEIRGGEKYLSAEKSAQLFMGHTLDLRCGHQQIFSNLRDSTRRNIKKAIKEKVEISLSHSLTAVREFYRLNTLTRKQHGLPPQPFSFFKILHDHVIAQDMGFVATATLAGHVIAANIYFNFGKEVIYKYGASDRKFQYLRANNLVMWEAIKSCCSRGFQNLCFGRTEATNKGLMQFKAGWGARQYLIHYYRYDLHKNAFTANTSTIHPFFKKIISMLPLSVLEMVGRILYRHMG